MQVLYFHCSILQYAMVSPTHMSEGKGSLNFRLVNMRDEIIMGFFRQGMLMGGGSRIQMILRSPKEYVFILQSFVALPRFSTRDDLTILGGRPEN